MSGIPSTTHLYRATLRQFVKNSIHERTKRSPTILLHLRKVFDQHAAETRPDVRRKLALDADNLIVYLKAHRIHKALIERYNSSDGLTQEERASKSAGMVGLDMPKPFDPNVAPTMEADRPELEKRKQQHQRLQQETKEEGEEGGINHQVEVGYSEKEENESGGSLQGFVPPGR